MTDDLEGRVDDIENTLAQLSGAEPSTSLPDGGHVTLAQVNREVQFIWRDIRAMKEEIGLIKAKLGM